MLTDTHAHAQFRAYEDKEGIVQRALESSVAVINVGTQLDTSADAVALAAKYKEGVYAVVGLHPSHTYAHEYIDENEAYKKSTELEFDYDAYKKLGENVKVVGIGECGLDYYRFPENVDIAYAKEQQKKAFEAQIKLALELNKALVIHCRPGLDSNDAYEDCYTLLAQVKKTQPQLRFEIHSFTGNADTALRFIELGGYIGLNGIITFDKTSRSENVVKSIPLESIVLETDSPYLAPLPYRGKQNEPAYVKYVAEKIAEWKGVSVEEVARQTTANATKLFNL